MAIASSSSNAADPHAAGLRRTAVIDLGSNSFRLVVFSAVPGLWWRRTDEIYDPVRIGAGADADGRLADEPMARAMRTIEMYGHFCRATGLRDEDIHPLATSAIREAPNRDEFLEAVHDATGLAVKVLAREEEARYGYLAAVNSTTLADGVVLDLGGGSMQLVEVVDRRLKTSESWRLGAVRMTERFLDDDGPASRKQLKALRSHVERKLESADWLGDAPRIVGLGGTARNLAAAAQKAARSPSSGVQGFVLTREALGELIEELAGRPPDRRGDIPGIKPERGDVILAGAAVIDAVLRCGDFASMEITEAGLREGAFFEALLSPSDPPLFGDVREASVRNLAGQYPTDPPHVQHVTHLALEMFDGTAEAGLHAGDPLERELLWAAAMLHDIGMTVDYDDHHKHSRYLILNAGLPGFTPREVALIAQTARYHRKGRPALGDLAPLAERGDEERVERAAALLRVAEQIERSRDQIVRRVVVAVAGEGIELALISDGDVSVAKWGVERQDELFRHAFGSPLAVAGD